MLPFIEPIREGVRKIMFCESLRCNIFKALSLLALKVAILLTNQTVCTRPAVLKELTTKILVDSFVREYNHVYALLLQNEVTRAIYRVSQKSMA